MTNPTFDTLAYMQQLRKAGVPDNQAEAQAYALGEALRKNWDDPVAKLDLVIELKALRNTLLEWVIWLFLAQALLFAALVKILH